MSLSFVYFDENGVFNGTVNAVNDLDPSDGTMIEFYAEQSATIYAKLEANDPGDQGSYDITFERILPPNAIEDQNIESGFPGAGVDQLDVPNCDSSSTWRPVRTSSWTPRPTRTRCRCTCSTRTGATTTKTQASGRPH